MNFRRTGFLAMLLFCLGPAFGQSDASYNGTWSITLDGKKSADLEGNVVVNGSEGTWRVITRSSKNPCVGRDYPLTVKKADAAVLVFEVGRAQVLTGCKNSTYTFSRVDEKTLKGEIREGTIATLKLE